MEETVNVVLPLPQGVWRGCSSRRVAKQLTSCRQCSAAHSLGGTLTGALTLADVQRAPLPTEATPRAWLFLAQEGERRVAQMTPCPPSSPHRRRGGSAQPLEPWRRARDELKPAKTPTWRARCRGVANHSRVAERTRLSPECEYSGVS